MALACSRRLQSVNLALGAWYKARNLHIQADAATGPVQEGWPATGVFGQAYQLSSLLGRGCAGEVWLSRNRETGQLCALKLMERPLSPDMVEQLCNEIAIQAGVGAGHVGVCHLREVLLAPSYTALALDYAEGGTVFGRLASRAAYTSQRQELCVPEGTARFMFRQLVSTVSFLHTSHISHQDIKLENTLLQNAASPTPPRIWLSDFQFAQHWGPAPAGRTNVRLGTAPYMSPEVLASLQTHRAVDPALGDVWACGVWLSTLLTGTLPFSCNPSLGREEMARHILRQQLRRPWRGSHFLKPYVSKLTPECVDLLDQMLHIDPRQRITAAEALEHPWMLKPQPYELEAAWKGLQAEQAELQAKLSARAADQAAVTCDERGNCSVLGMVRTAAAPFPPGAAAAPLMRIDCTRPEVVASLHGALS